MMKNEQHLQELHDMIYGNGNEPECNFEEMTINYNEDGDTYYALYCHFDEPKSISVCAYIKGQYGEPDCKAGITINIYNDWYETLDYIVEHGEEIEKRLNDEFEKKARQQREQIKQDF